MHAFALNCTLAPDSAPSYQRLSDVGFALPPGAMSLHNRPFPPIS